MTEQLMEDLTNEEHEALLLMSEHGIAAPLSPAAQAVFREFNRAASGKPDDWHYLPAIAAALRAAADQVVPSEPEPEWWEPVRPSFNRQCIRRQFLAIATELENCSD